MNPSIDILPAIKAQFEDGVRPDITGLHVIGYGDGSFGLAVLRGTTDPEHADQEANDIAFILNELKKSIESVPRTPAYIQPLLAGFDGPELERFERNKDAMRACPGDLGRN